MSHGSKSPRRARAEARAIDASREQQTRLGMVALGAILTIGGLIAGLLLRAPHLTTP